MNFHRYFSIFFDIFLIFFIHTGIFLIPVCQYRLLRNSRSGHIYLSGYGYSHIFKITKGTKGILCLLNQKKIDKISMKISRNIDEIIEKYR